MTADQILILLAPIAFAVGLTLLSVLCPHDFRP